MRHVNQEKEKCCGCGICARVCPTKALNMKCDEEGFLYPDINEMLCVGCGRCMTYCPEKEVKSIIPGKNAYAAQAIDKNTLKSSTSGGVAFQIAEYYVSRDDIVFAAVFDERHQVIHKKITSIDQLSEIQGSKYVQSKLNLVLDDIIHSLHDGRQVLFIGTPCQVAAMKKLTGENDNLMTVSLICEGVPSPGLWERYCKEYHVLPQSQVVFRDKEDGWGDRAKFKVTTEKKIQSEPFHKNPFCRFMIQCLSLRPSCYACPFKQGSDIGNVTIGDLWGIK